MKKNVMNVFKVLNYLIIQNHVYKVIYLIVKLILIMIINVINVKRVML